MSRNDEARIQASIVSYVRAVAPEVIIFHPANGGLRTKSEAARMKWIGVLAGVFDLVLLIPGGRVALIEVKSAQGRLSPEQVGFRDRLIRLGIPHCIVKSIDEVRIALAQWGISTRESEAA